MDIGKLIKLRNSVKKEYSINDKPHKYCDHCGRELDDNAMMNMGRTICFSCFYNDLRRIRISEVDHDE